MRSPSFRAFAVCGRNKNSKTTCKTTILILKLLKQGRRDSFSYAIFAVLFFKTRKPKRRKTIVHTNAAAHLDFAPYIETMVDKNKYEKQIW